MQFRVLEKKTVKNYVDHLPEPRYIKYGSNWWPDVIKNVLLIKQMVNCTKNFVLFLKKLYDPILLIRFNSLRRTITGQFTLIWYLFNRPRKEKRLSPGSWIGNLTSKPLDHWSKKTNNLITRVALNLEYLNMFKFNK